MRRGSRGSCVVELEWFQVPGRRSRLKNKLFDCRDNPTVSSKRTTSSLGKRWALKALQEEVLRTDRPMATLHHTRCYRTSTNTSIARSLFMSSTFNFLFLNSQISNIQAVFYSLKFIHLYF